MGKRTGKAPPVDLFTGESDELKFNNWLCTLQRASDWNGWRDEETLLQLAGHLRGRAIQQWSLLDETEKHDFKVLAVHDFRHLAQGKKETVSELIRRLERTFRIAYGRDSMSVETRDALLYSQLQDALKHELMRSPAVSGSTSYKDLCVAARNEERRISGLKKWEAYNKLDGYTSQSSYSEAPKRARSTTHSNSLSEKPDATQGRRPATSNGGPRCFTCGKSHLWEEPPGTQLQVGE